MRKIFIGLVCLISLNVFAGTDFCTFSSGGYPELQNSMNKDALCNSVVRAVVAEGYIEGSPLSVTVTGQLQYGPSMSFSFKTAHGVVSGFGQEYWNPDQELFVIQK